jgi:hypothetical protein
MKRNRIEDAESAWSVGAQVDSRWTDLRVGFNVPDDRCGMN